MISMQARARFEKILKKNNHPELYVARHKFIQSFFRFYKNDITQDAKTEVGEDERCWEMLKVVKVLLRKVKVLVGRC